jgi:hypothetical protein
MRSRLSSVFAPTLCIFALAANSIAQEISSELPSAPVEVVYIVTGSSIQTYDVNAATGQPTQEGQPLTIPVFFPTVVPSSDGHFLYVQGNDSHNMEHLLVYPTDSSGVPQLPAIENLIIPRTTGLLQLDPNSALAYASQSTVDSKGDTHAEMRLFHIDTATGTVTEDPNVVATYPLNGPCLRGDDTPGFFGVFGFNPAANRLYDIWTCSYYDTGGSTFYTQQVNQQTGSLGAAVQTFAVGDNELSGQLNLIYFTPKSLLYFDVPYDYVNGYNSLSVYPLSGGTTPTFTCTAAMLEACGYGTWAIPDPSGNFVFFNIGDTTQITHLDLPSKTITDTGYYVSGYKQLFSPSDLLVYSQLSSTSAPYFVDIYAFDPSTGAVTTSPEADIAVQQPLFSVVPAVRK